MSWRTSRLTRRWLRITFLAPVANTATQWPGKIQQRCRSPTRCGCEGLSGCFGKASGGYNLTRTSLQSSCRSMLDFLTMSYWRKLFLVLLLALSLPVQSFAAISMKCGSSHVGSDVAYAQHEDIDESVSHRHVHDLTMTDSDRDSHSHGGDSHHAHSCSTCASCCSGGALPAVPTVVASVDVFHLVVPFPRSDRVVSFLTDGIERPPRISLV